MKFDRVALGAMILGLTLAAASPGLASQDNVKAKPPADLSGLHASDLRMGKWHVVHRRLKERLAGDTRWETFTGEQVGSTVLDGYGNTDENLLRLPGGDYRISDFSKAD